MGIDTLFEVGQYTAKFNALTSQNLPCGPIMQSSGLEVHIRKHHPKLVPSMSLISQIIAQPDYVGVNPKEPNSVELVKVIGDNLKVCVKLDQKEGYLFVASFYDMTPAKVQNHLRTGRLKVYK